MKTITILSIIFILVIILHLYIRGFVSPQNIDWTIILIEEFILQLIIYFIEKKAKI